MKKAAAFLAGFPGPLAAAGEGGPLRGAAV